MAYFVINYDDLSILYYIKNNRFYRTINNVTKRISESEYISALETYYNA